MENKRVLKCDHIKKIESCIDFVKEEEKEQQKENNQQSSELRSNLELLLQQQYDHTNLENNNEQIINYLVKSLWEIDTMIANFHKQLIQIYEGRGIKLSNIIKNPLIYAKIVTYIQNSDQANNSDLQNIISKSQAFDLQIALNNDKIQKLNNYNLNISLTLALLITLSYNIKMQKINEHSQIIQHIAPNLHNFLGAQIASELIYLSGSLFNLSTMPACNIQLLGSAKSDLPKNKRIGIIGNLKLYQETQDNYKTQIKKRICNTISKLSKLDICKGPFSIQKGQTIIDKMLQQFENYCGPKQQTLMQPLKTPLDMPKKRRGGKKYRIAKQRNELTQLQQIKNRLKFGTNIAEEAINTLEDQGMLGQRDTNILSIMKKDNKIKMSKKQKKQQQLAINQAQNEQQESYRNNYNHDNDPNDILL